MTPEEALALLTQATAEMMGTRADHQRVSEALAVLRTLAEGEHGER